MQETLFGFPSYFLLTSKKFKFLLGDLQHPSFRGHPTVAVVLEPGNRKSRVGNSSDPWAVPSSMVSCRAGGSVECMAWPPSNYFILCVYLPKKWVVMAPFEVSNLVCPPPQKVVVCVCLLFSELKKSGAEVSPAIGPQYEGQLQESERPGPITVTSPGVLTISHEDVFVLLLKFGIFYWNVFRLWCS